MQLAILLHLVHVKGAALPEKRTTLYEEYMKLFFDRKAGKSPLVRRHRDLIIAIHGSLAWTLQLGAERGSGSGSITRPDLLLEIRRYLEEEQYNLGLADAILEGSVERVGALVSRVEGTFEFEVQPLREYFTALHLYRTSPYCPPGEIHKGTRPDRFGALTHNFFWTNVARFFCGFYDVGELGSLVDGLEQLDDEEGYKLINQPRYLALMLLSDYVFSQSPRTTRRLIKYVVKEPGFSRLIAGDSSSTQRSLALPEAAGREDFREACIEKLSIERDIALQNNLHDMIAVNTDPPRMKKIWLDRYKADNPLADPFGELLEFGIAESFTPQEVVEITKDDLELRGPLASVDR